MSAACSRAFRLYATQCRCPSTLGSDGWSHPRVLHPRNFEPGRDHHQTTPSSNPWIDRCSRNYVVVGYRFFFNGYSSITMYVSERTEGILKLSFSRVQHLVRRDVRDSFVHWIPISVQSFSSTRNSRNTGFLFVWIPICSCECIKVTRSWLVFEAFCVAKLETMEVARKTEIDRKRNRWGKRERVLWEEEKEGGGVHVRDGIDRYNAPSALRMIPWIVKRFYPRWR